MNMKIKTISLSNFRGIKNKTIELDGNTVIKGENGTGKSTFGMALGWVFADSDLELVKNPNITPLGEDECLSKVEIELELDGKPITVSKAQKFKKKEVDGKTTSSISNSYEINSVEKSYKNFIADMEERGLDIERFNIFSNPNAFMADTSKSGRDKMRSTLFQMASDLSDKDIVNGLENVDELKALLEKGYTVEEVEQMNKSTIRKITEVNGKDNAIIDGKIEGMISSKASIDVKALSSQKADYEKELAEIKAEIQDMASADKKKRKTISLLEDTMRGIQEDLLKDYDESVSEFKEKLRVIVAMHEDNLANIENKAKERDRLTKTLESEEESLNSFRELYKKVQDEVLDEESTKCPTCHREYDKDHLDEIKADFEESKSKRLNEYKKRADEINKTISDIKSQIADCESYIETNQPELDRLGESIEGLREKIDNYKKPNVENNPAYKKAKEDIAIIEGELAESDDSRKADLTKRESVLEEMIRQIVGELAVADRNSDIDKEIEKLREDKRQGEINKANAEKVINQVDIFKREKNEKLTESINEKFSIISFKLFDFRKNGEYVDTIEILIDGKPMSSCANGSLITLAKIDCVAGLQNFFKQNIPIIVDDAALITSNTSERLSVESQVIKLVASEGVKELEVCKERN